jgi:hypothetical protein
MGILVRPGKEIWAHLLQKPLIQVRRGQRRAKKRLGERAISK